MRQTTRYMRIHQSKVKSMNWFTYLTLHKASDDCETFGEFFSFKDSSDLLVNFLLSEISISKLFELSGLGLDILLPRTRHSLSIDSDDQVLFFWHIFLKCIVYLERCARVLLVLQSLQDDFFSFWIDLFGFQMIQNSSPEVQAVLTEPFK